MNTPKSILILFLFFCLGFSSFAQKGARRERIEKAKIEFLRKRLNLSDEQNGKFWLLYEELENKRREIKRSLASLRSGASNLTATDEQLKEDLKNLFQLKQSEVDLEREYFDKFQKVINIRQLTELYKSEKLFAIELLKRLEDRRGKKQE